MTVAASPALTVAKTHWRQWPWATALAVLLIAAYAYLLISRFAPAISQPDDNGYFAQGTLLAQTGHTWFAPASDAQYIGMHWLVTPDEKLISRYPPGLAALIAVAYQLGGYKLAAMINPALALAALVGLYFLARHFLDRWWALAAVASMMFIPSFTHHALSGDAHMAVAACIVWGLYFLLRWQHSQKLWQIFVAGLILGCIPTIRYPDAIVALGIAAFMLWQWRSLNKPWLHFLVAIAGALVPIIPLLIRNQLILGAFWRTGYALTNEQTGFAWDYFEQHAIDYIRQVQGNGLGLIAALGITGITTMICTKKLRAHGLMFALIAIPLLLLYMAYYWAPQMNSAATMRFIMPTFAVYIIAGLWALREFTHTLPNRAAILAVPLVLLVIHALWGTRETLQSADQLAYQKGTLAAITDELTRVAGRDDVVVSDNHVLQNLDFVRQWKLADMSVMRGGFGGRGGGGGGGFGNNRDPDAPSPGQAAKRDWQREKYPGTTAEQQDKFTADVKNWADGNKIFYVGTESALRQVRQTFNITSADIKIVSRVPLPEPPQQRNRNSIMGTPRRDTLNNTNNNQQPPQGPPDGPRDNAPGMGPPPGGQGGPGGPNNNFGPGNFGGGRRPFGGMGGMGGPGGGMGGPFGNRFANEKEAIIAEITLK